MTQPQRKTTNRDRISIERVSGTPAVEIGIDEILESKPADISINDLTTALEKVKELWTSEEVDYVAPIAFEGNNNYSVYAPDKSEGWTKDVTVPEYIDNMKNFPIGREGVVGVYIDTVRLHEDPEDLHIAKVVLRKS